MPFSDATIIHWPLKLNPKGDWPKIRHAIAKADSQGSFIRTFEDNHGWIDVLIHNAGADKFRRLIEKLDVDEDIKRAVASPESWAPLTLPAGLANHLFQSDGSHRRPGSKDKPSRR